MPGQGIFQGLVNTPLSHFDIAFDDFGKSDQVQEDNVNLASTFSANRSELLEEVHLFYQQGLFCDLKLVGGNVDQGFNCVSCHAIVLSAAIPKLSKILEWAFHTSDEDKYARLYFPDFQHQDLKSFVDSIYSSLKQDKIIKCNYDDPLKILVPGALAQAFGLNHRQSNVIDVPSFADKENIANKSIQPKPLEALETIQKGEELFTDGDDAGIDMPVCMPDSDHTVARERGGFSTSEDLSPIYLKSLEHIKDEELSKIPNGQHVLPYSWSLSEPSLFSSAEELQNLLESFSDSGAVIQALTGDPFHFTQELGDSECYEGSTCYTNKIKKLVRLPNTTIFAVVAVGVRHNDADNNSVNVLQPLAVRNWPVKMNFDNLVEMLLNVAGISKCDFYSSDHYYKFKKVKASKPNRIGRALQGLKKLTPEELESLKLKTSCEMQQLEEVHLRSHFTHLPTVPVKMQFALVTNMPAHERTDYAILYGNDQLNLNVKSLVNFKVRDFTKEDWIAIFTDLIVAFANVENPLLLRNLKDLFEPVDQLLFRHQAFELLNNPKKRYCIPCRTVFPYSSDAEKTAYDLHAQEHCIKKEDSASAGLLSCTGSVKCSKLFQSKEALEEHVAKSHDKSVKGDGSYCDSCGKFLPNVHRLKKHHDAHHRQIKCKVCGSFFPGTIGLASHRDKVHSQKLPCPHCHKLLPSRVKLEYHMISHMKPEEKKYICEKCGKRFGWSHHLQKHEMNVHVRSRPYKCSVSGCNWAFNDLSNRNMHERRVHKLGPPPKR